MKVRIRCKAGGRLFVTDEKGDPIEGLTAVQIQGHHGLEPVVRLTIRAPEISVDADAMATGVEHEILPTDLTPKKKK